MKRGRQAALARKLARMTGQLSDIASELRPYAPEAAQTLNEAGYEIATISLGLDSPRSPHD